MTAYEEGFCELELTDTMTIVWCNENYDVIHCSYDNIYEVVTAETGHLIEEFDSLDEAIECAMKGEDSE